MPNQVIPILQLDKAGLVADQPPVAIPPNAFSDCLNVRFKDGVVRKMEGEVNIFPEIFELGDIVKYIAWWPSPNLAAFNAGYYLIIVERDDGTIIEDHLFFIKPGDTNLGDVKGRFSPSGQWQHTFFQGGFALVVNNGVNVPQYVLDPEGNELATAIPTFAQLPGWDSYLVNESVLDGIFEVSNSRVFDLGQDVDFASNQVIVEVLTSETDGTPISFNIVGVDQDELFMPGPLPDAPVPIPSGNVYNIYRDATSNTTVVVFGDGLVSGNRARLSIRSRNAVQVRAGVIRSFGDFLVAGNLTERDQTDLDIIIRSLPGVVRSSDVAAPGAIPNNWNPFAVGVSTADEFVVTQDGIVQDLVELQSNLYIYSNSSISVMRLTGNPEVPLAVTPVTTSYGCLTTEGVLEYDGKHVVVGSQDIYLFGGHPGSIQSVGDGRVRNLLYDRINPLEESSLFMLRYQQQDEIWICYASVDSIGSARDEALIWNYRNNTWTKRSLPSIYSGDVGPIPGGGLPSAQINLDGESSDNTDLVAGVINVQRLMIPDNITIPREGVGTNTEYNILVQNDDEGNFPEFSAVGPTSFQIKLNSGFYSGTATNELFMTFTGLTASGGSGAALVYSFEVQLEPELRATTDPIATMSVTSIIASLTASPDFRANFEIHDVDQRVAPGEFVIVGTNADAVTASLNVGTRRLFARGELSEAPLLDVVGTIIEDTLATDRYLVSFFVPAANVPLFHYFNFSSDVGARIFRVNQGADPDLDLREYSDMYDETTGALMYETGRGGESERPFVGPSQRMYRTVAGPEFTELDITEAFIPRSRGVYDFVVEYDNPGFVLNNIRLQAYTAETLTDGMPLLDKPSTRSGFSGGNPEVTFITEHLIYEDFMMDVAGHYVRDGDEPNTQVVSFSGDYRVNGRQLITDQIRDIFHNTNSLWTTRAPDVDGFTAELESRTAGAYELRVGTISPAGSGLTLDHFDVEQVTHGTWGWHPDAPRDRSGILQRLAVYPQFTISNPGSQFISMQTDVEQFQVRLDASADDLDSQDITRIIEEALADQLGWIATSDIEPLRVSVETAVIPDMLRPLVNPLNLMEIQDVPAERPSGLWSITLASRGNVRTGGADNNLVTTIPTTTTHNPQGVYATKHTPSYLFLQIRNAEATDSTGDYAGQELLILQGPPTPMAAELVAEFWISRLRRAAPRLTIRDEGTAGEFSVAPNNYGDLANFILVPSINTENFIRAFDMSTPPMSVETTVRHLDTCRDLLQASLYWNGEGDRIQLNPASTVPYIDIPQLIRTDGYKYFNAGRNDLHNASTLDPNSRTQGVSLVFDTIRSWPDDEVNFNFEVPIFVARQDILGADQTLQGVNKVLGADIGWTTPAFSIAGRSDGFSESGATRIITGNDAPQNYESFVERKSFGLTPEFDTEQLSAAAIWGDGSTVETFGEAPHYNRLEIRTAGSNSPGAIADLNAAGNSSQSLKKNAYFISDDYKVDLRTNGRFLNLKITDNITDMTEFGDATDVNQDVYDNGEKTFRKDAEWRISGIQLEIAKAGTR